MSDDWVDANVLVRFLTADPPEMAQRARALWAQTEREGFRLHIPVLIIAEVVWVLGSFYKWQAPAIAEGLGKLIGLDQADVEDRDLVAAALQMTVAANVSFVDAYLAAAARKAGAPVASFDRNFRRLDVEWFEPA